MINQNQRNVKNFAIYTRLVTCFKDQLKRKMFSCSLQRYAGSLVQLCLQKVTNINNLEVFRKHVKRQTKDDQKHDHVNLQLYL